MSSLDLRTQSCVVVPALDAERSVGEVVLGARMQAAHVIVVDDGSSDATAARASEAGAEVLRHGRNRGKGAALASGLSRARSLGYAIALTLDADGQHPPAELAKLLAASDDPGALVLGVRDLAGAGAPRANRMSNGFANGFLSMVTRLRLRDTQCGMRRYPIASTLSLGVRDERFGFETEVILRARRAGMRIVQVPIEVLYPADRSTHFDARRDPWRIVGRVLRTLARDLV